ncbi:MAG: hypothetical protein Q8R11_02755 [bacterium]|nr:hypothetical protein [bacterium]
MNSYRITVSLPAHIYTGLQRSVRRRGVSRFIAQAVERQLLEEKTEDPVDAFLALRGKFPFRNRKEILEAIHRGRQ